MCEKEGESEKVSYGRLLPSHKPQAQEMSGKVK